MFPFLLGLSCGSSRVSDVTKGDLHDFSCCAICHSKLAQEECDKDIGGIFSQTNYFKQWICKECLINCKVLNIPIVSKETLLTWIENSDKKEVIKAMRKLGYCPCFMNPLTDRKYDEILDAIIKEAIGV